MNIVFGYFIKSDHACDNSELSLLDKDYSKLVDRLRHTEREKRYCYARVIPVKQRTEVATVDQIRLLVMQEGLDGFQSADLQEQDLPSIGWSGDALHLDIMRDQLRASDIGADTIADTIAIYSPDGTVVSKGYVVHNPSLANQHSGESVISQLATRPELQSLGFGKRLMAALEERIVKRGNHKAVLGVETNNPRARELYNRLGYQYFKTEVDSWQAVDDKGQEYTHQTDVDWLFKLL